MDFTLPEDLRDYLAELDEFIEREIRPLELENDNIRFFDHRREDARTDWDRGGLPSRDWEALLAEARRRADAAGHFRYAFPKEYGGRDGTNLGMALIREHLARKGLGLHCDLQNEHAIVGNNVGLLLMLHYGSPEQKAEWVDDLAAGRRHFAFGITEPAHGSDATFMETRAVRVKGAGEVGGDWVINGEKTWNTGIHTATHDLVFARTSGTPGSGTGITGFLVPAGHPRLHGRGVPVDLQHAHRPRARLVHRRARAGQCHPRHRRPRPADRPALLQREPHPPGRLQPGRRAVLHRPLGGVRQGQGAVRQAAREQPGDPVPAGRAADAGRDAAGAHPQDRVEHGHVRAAHPVREGLHVQLRGQPAVLRGRRPRHAGARRPGLLAAPAVRAHLPAPPPVPHHRGRRGDPDAPGGGLPVRLHQAGHPQGRHLEPLKTG